MKFLVKILTSASSFAAAGSIFLGTQDILQKHTNRNTLKNKIDATRWLVIDILLSHRYDETNN